MGGSPRRHRTSTGGGESSIPRGAARQGRVAAVRAAPPAALAMPPLPAPPIGARHRARPAPPSHRRPRHAAPATMQDPPMSSEPCLRPLRRAGAPAHASTAASAARDVGRAGSGRRGSRAARAAEHAPADGARAARVDPPQRPDARRRSWVPLATGGQIRADLVYRRRRPSANVRSASPVDRGEMTGSAARRRPRAARMPSIAGARALRQGLSSRRCSSPGGGGRPRTLAGVERQRGEIGEGSGRCRRRSSRPRPAIPRATAAPTPAASTLGRLRPRPPTPTVARGGNLRRPAPACNPRPFGRCALLDRRQRSSRPLGSGGHRVFVDGRYAGDSPGPIKVHRGPHDVDVGWRQRWHPTNRGRAVRRRVSFVSTR